MGERPIKATLEDVAREAGVSLATVDRVLNRRPGVRALTAERVEAAMARLGYRPDPLAVRLARGKTFRFCFILPTGTNTFMRMLTEQARQTGDWLMDQRALTDVVHVDVFDPQVLAEALERVGPSYDGIAVVALDHPAVREAIDALVARGVAVVTLVSDVPNSRRLRFVGIDNSAAGRTAGWLVGRFAGGRRGPVGLIVGSLALRDHAERHFGFQQVIAAEFPNLEVLPAREGRDDTERTRRAVEEILVEHPDLVGLYNVGAGNRGVNAALEGMGQGRKLVVVLHDLTPHNRQALVRGTIDAVINQDPGHEARSAGRILLAHCSGQPVYADQERIRIDIFVRDNLP